MKKFVLVTLAMGVFTFAAAPSSDAGVTVGIDLGFPAAYPYPYYGCGYPYYPYYGYYRPSVYIGPSFYWYHGHRVYYPRRYHRHYHYWH
jgi:hypothetical protein